MRHEDGFGSMKAGYPSLLILLVLLGALAACTEEVKPNQDSILATKTIGTVQKIFDYYDQRDFHLVRGYVSEDFTTLRLDENFEKATHEFTVRWVKITRDDIRIIVGWQAGWKLARGESSSGGQCTLSFSLRDGKLIGLEGDHPFIVPSIKALPGAPAL